MTASNAQMHSRPLAIAPAPARVSLIDFGADRDSAETIMPYTCQTCAKRKVKCDKATPICSSCRKGKLECIYQAPPLRRRRRKLVGDVSERLAPYERILHEHGLLPQDPDAPPSIEETPKEAVSLNWMEPETARTGKLLAGQGKSRYIHSNLWRSLGDDEMQRMSVDEDEDQAVPGVAGAFASDPLTDALMGHQQSLLEYYPSYAEAITLWNTHIENVEPICKVLHIPSTSKMVEMASQQPEMASKADECLLFAIYHFAVFSMTEEECAQKFGQWRATLMQRYHFATRQALVNASFLKCTQMKIMQALVLFLIPCRFCYDAHVYWILTGVAMRIAQRMGLHRDGEKLGLPPFDVQLRRRLFYQLIPLDGVASQMSGTGIGVMPDTWDTQQPLNINDNQIWPGMTETPEEQKGATEMIFCLARACVGKYSAMAGKSMHGASSGHFKDYNEVERVINEAESEVEEKYLRYCDIVNPLHILTICLARSAITAMRLRIRLPKVRDQTVPDAERRELFQLSQKIMDTDKAAYAQTSVRKYLWHGRSFFAWGSWDSLIFVLTSLRGSDLPSAAEAHAAWSMIEQMYNNHGELLESKQALHVAVRRLTLEAWDANPQRNSVPQPPFITSLRSILKVSLKSRAERQDSDSTNTISPTSPPRTSDANAFIDSLSDSMELDVSNDIYLESVDWMFWDQLITQYQAQGG